MSPDLLEKFPLLEGLDEVERQAVAHALEPLDLGCDVVLFREGEHADAALFVVSGRVRVHSPRVAATAELGAGEVLGTLSLVVEGPREATAETMSRCRLGRLSRSDYRLLASSAPGAACRLLEGILREYAGALREDVRSAGTAAGQLDPLASSD